MQRTFRINSQSEMENYHCAIDCQDYDKQGLFKRKYYDQDTS